MVASPLFFAFLAGTALVYWLLPRPRLRALFLALASLLYVGGHDRWAALLTVAMTLFSFAVARRMAAHRDRPVYFRLGIAGLLLLLAAFKYLGFLDSILGQLAQFVHGLPRFRLEPLLLPLGISYLTFKLISYLTDIHWGIQESPGRLVDLLAFTSLFTIFVAGPIERFERLAPQLGGGGRARPDSADLGFAGRRILYGLFKKLVIADWIGFFINPVWADFGAFPPAMQWAAMFGFTVQAYLDFSGYSDVAIGASRLFGLKVQENFDWPLLQPSINEFWRRWHMSLVSWLRDYLFTPLTVKHRRWGKGAQVYASIVVFTLCGLWHGAGWGFIAWGFLHGLALSLDLLTRDWRRRLVANRPLLDAAMTGAGVLVTFAFVTFTILFFRAGVAGALAMIRDIR